MCLQAAKDVLEYNAQLDKLNEWLDANELMLANSAECGRDYEHCAQLIRRADEAHSPQANEERVARVVDMGERLAAQGKLLKILVTKQMNERMYNKRERESLFCSFHFIH